MAGTRSRRQARDDDEEEDTKEVAEEEEEEEEPASSSKKKRVSKPELNTTTSQAKRTRKAIAEDDEDEDDDDAETDVAKITRKRSERESLSNPASSKPNYSTEAFLKIDEFVAAKSNAQAGMIKVGAPEKPPSYQSNSRSNAAASELASDDLENVVSAVTRLVLARQLNGKPLTATDINGIVLTKLAAVSYKKDFGKLLLGYIRYEVAKRLKDVFGFELFAGGEDLKVSDKWHIVNALENDELKRLLDSNDMMEEGDADDGDDDEGPKKDEASNEANKLRGALMVVLATIMMQKGEVSEDDIITDLSKFGMSEKTVAQLKKDSGKRMSIPDVLGKLSKQGFIVKHKRDNKFYYEAASKAENEIGKRNVLLFLIQSCGFNLDEQEEANLLRTQ